jgi:hypothetical protein
MLAASLEFVEWPPIIAAAHIGLARFVHESLNRLDQPLWLKVIPSGMFAAPIHARQHAIRR